MTYPNNIPLANDSIQYFQVDVFSQTPLSGNGLSVFPYASGFSSETMQRLTAEMRQFESIFLEQIESDTYRARIFAMEEELGFAGHPSLGAAATLHAQLKPDQETASWILKLNAKTVTIETVRTPFGFQATMNQGNPEFGAVLNLPETRSFLAALNLTEEHWDERIFPQVVSTGLPYLFIPVKAGKGLNAKIMVSDLAEKLHTVGAKFVGIVDPTTLRMRTWNNTGMFEDIATGSMAGPFAALLHKYHFLSLDHHITLYQGENLGRPSELNVVLKNKNGKTEIYVSGGVVKIAGGRFDTEAAKTIWAGN